MKEKIINHQKMIENLKNPLLNLHYKVYDGNKGKRKKRMKKAKNKYTLNQLGSKIDQIGDMVMKIADDVNMLKKDVKGINTRLDYIVVANNLKDLPKENR